MVFIKIQEYLKGANTMFLPKFEDLGKLTEKELAAMYDSNMQSYTITPSFFLYELHRRMQERHARAIKRLTFCIAIMTGIMTISTILNVILFCKFG